MRRTAQISFATVLGCAAASSAVAQTPLDARDIRPSVMLLVDTSGSMEKLPDDGSGTERMPTCTNNIVTDASQKNRWAMTVEALSGTIQNYTCRAVDRTSAGYISSDYDYGYYLPHIDFGANPTQATDGILDSFSRRVKFGLMTFDGVGTTIGGETLVPYRDWATTSYQNQVNGGPGMYSYGRVGRLSFPGCPTDYGVNAGARSAAAPIGGLISVGLSDNSDDVEAVNQRIQRSLLDVRPYGGTPIPAMLDDLEFYYKEHADVRSGSDPLYTCRKRRAILITDGAPDALFRDPRFQCDTLKSKEDLAKEGKSPCASPSATVPEPPPGSPATDCECPYDTATDITKRLLDSNLIEQLIVVAYNVQDPTALATLNAIAQVGWSKSATATPPSTGPYPYLIIASGPNELRNKLSDLLEGSQPGVTSRSVPISVNTNDNVLGASSKRFDITAGFQLGRNTDDPWSGLLVRRRVLCEGTTVNDAVELSDAAGDLFHSALNRQGAAGRTLYTVTPQDLSLSNATMRNTSYNPAFSAVQDSDRFFDNSRLPLIYNARNDKTPEGGDFTILDRLIIDDSVTISQGLATDNINPSARFDNSINTRFFGDANGNGVPGEGADRQRVVEYVRGTSRPTKILADIYHSNPVALVPLTAGSRFDDLDQDYAQWRRALVRTTSGGWYSAGGRPGVVFVGTNDGVLHAFNLDDWSDRNSTQVPGGRELWGFVPPALFGKMAAAATPVHQFMFDGTPQVRDVLLQKLSDRAGIYRTVLVSALRGAPAFVALDVTHPEEPEFMWQTTFPDVGETVGNPAITQVTVEWNGRVQRRGVAILPAGSGEASSSLFCPSGKPVVDRRTRASSPTNARDAVRCWKRRGRSLYVVDLATGQLIQEFGAEHFPSPLTGSVVVDSPGVADSTAAYFYDHDGVLWRLSMMNSNPNQWRVAPIYDAFAGPHIRSVSAPLTQLRPWEAGRVPQHAPAVTRDNNGNLVIIAGTGDVDNALDTANQRVLSLTELRADSSGEIGGSVKLNWQIDLEDNEVVTGPLTIFQDNVYWGSFTSQSGGNACALGISERYGVHAYTPMQPASTPPAPKGQLLVSTGTGMQLEVKERIEGDGSNLVLGLTVARQPICLGSASPNAVTGQSVSSEPPGGGQYQLRAMMAGSSSGGALRGGSPIREMTPVGLQTGHKASVAGWAGIVE